MFQKYDVSASMMFEIARLNYTTKFVWKQNNFFAGWRNKLFDSHILFDNVGKVEWKTHFIGSKSNFLCILSFPFLFVFKLLFISRSQTS